VASDDGTDFCLLASAEIKLASTAKPSPPISPHRDTAGLQYGPFLPKDKSALAAQIINKVWLETPSRPSIAPPDMALKEHLGRCAF
jgi:hypothetical protein